MFSLTVCDHIMTALGQDGRKVTALKVLLRESPVAWAAYEGAVG